MLLHSAPIEHKSSGLEVKQPSAYNHTKEKFEALLPLNVTKQSLHSAPFSHLLFLSAHLCQCSVTSRYQPPPSHMVSAELHATSLVRAEESFAGGKGGLRQRACCPCGWRRVHTKFEDF